MISKFKYPLVKDTIKNEEIDQLRDWLGTYPQLTKGKLTEKFESNWSNWNKNKYSVFVNSGSSANLLMFYAYKCMTNKENIKVVAPAVSWVTTVSPIIQLGMQPILCDCDEKSLGVDINHLENIFKKNNPDLLIIVHVLGHQNDMKSIIELCKKYNVVLFEDSCEAPGTQKDGKKVGTYGLASSFSFYYGHHMSTVEGGMVVTDNNEFLNIMRSIRGHGWSRDLDLPVQEKLKKKYSIDDFRNMYTFYYPGFNLRSTDVNAFIGINQIKTLDEKVNRRHNVYLKYKSLLQDYFWIQQCDADIISNFALGLIVDDFDRYIDILRSNDIETRPLICGSIGEQPFWTDKFGKSSSDQLKNARRVHNNGFYIPAHQDLDDGDIDFISEILIKITKKK